MSNKLGNMKKYISLSKDAWQETDNYGLLTIGVSKMKDGSNKLISESGHEFINLSSCSYLGFDGHPDIIRAANKAISDTGSINMPTSRLRVRFSLLNETEEALTQHLNCVAFTAISCGVASYGILPILASGFLTNEHPPIMIFDRFAHLSMQRVKPICGQETEILSCPNNDVNYIEDICKKHKYVAYVTDGVFSVGGGAPVSELLELQNKYGLYLFFDDSHSLSVIGDKGQGYVRTLLPEMNDQTIIVSSLVKSFAASGSVVMVDSIKKRQIFDRFGGPLSWSQCIDTAAMGAIQGSIRLHQSPELAIRQKKLHDNLVLFDKLITTQHAGSDFPVRIIELEKEQHAIEYARQLYDAGFFTSSVFFPVVPKGKAGLRLMMRADLTTEQIHEFSNAVKKVVGNEKN